MDNKILERIINLINDDYNQEKTIENITESTDIIVELGINSVDALELLIKIEDEFSIEIPDEKLNLELLRNLVKLAEYVKELI